MNKPITVYVVAKIEELPISLDKEWLKPMHNVYVHTSEELLELKKKWCEEAFDAGLGFGNFPMSLHNKETYVNNLTI
jgi:hypothetical protein